MKKIINGKKYDTFTATEIFNWDNDQYGFSRCSETLYRKSTGEFFLYGQGGPMSKYSRRIDQNSWCEGEQIVPLTLEEAKLWLEEKSTVQRYEELFGEVNE
jgi:hypothetical protein